MQRQVKDDGRGRAVGGEDADLRDTYRYDNQYIMSLATRVARRDGNNHDAETSCTRFRPSWVGGDGQLARPRAMLSISR